jgi:hypothetical protein
MKMSREEKVLKSFHEKIMDLCSKDKHTATSEEYDRYIELAKLAYMIGYINSSSDAGIFGRKR